MAKKIEISSFALFAAAAVLIALGWLTPFFPLLIFFGFAPLFALTDRTQASSVWEKMEWVLLALTLSFLAARSLDLAHAVSAMLFGILFTIAFVGYVWVRRTLGNRAGKITIIIFWLALEYLLLKTIPEKGIFLSDALRLQGNWMRWNVHTGFLGASLWILMVNLLVYQVLLSQEPYKWHWIILAALFLIGPIVYSMVLGSTFVSREEMVAFYAGKSGVKDVMYLARSEFIVRTAAWLSTLILLFTFVKSQTAK